MSLLLSSRIATASTETSSTTVHNLPSMSSSMSSSSTATTTFTSQLHTTLNQSRIILDTWVNDEKRRIDQHVQHAKQELITKQRTIDTTSAQLLALQLQYGCNIGNTTDHTQLSSSSSTTTGEPSNNNNNKLSVQQTELETKIQVQTKKNQLWNTKLDELKKQVQDLQIHKENMKLHVQTIQQQAFSTSNDTTIHDLTLGLRNYKYLGLDFRRADYDRLKFSFTQLDPTNPNQEYSFCLGFIDNNDEIWSIYDCSPAVLSDETLAALIEPLNQTNDMLSFTRNIRNEFLRTISTGS